MMKKIDNKPHISSLDSLRGFAALSVCLFHFSGLTLPKLSNPEIGKFFAWGWAGVEIFFVISGFIIPFVLAASQHNYKKIHSFLGKRIIRVNPPAYVALLLTVLLYFFIDYFGLSKNNWFANLSLDQIAHNLAFTIPLTNHSWVNSVFWTLSVEFQFYLFISVAYFVMFKNLGMFVASAALLLATHYLPAAKYLQFFYYSSMFLIGGLTFLLIKQSISKSGYFLLLTALTLAAAHQLGPTAAIFGCATSLIIAFTKTENKVGAFLGKISYSLYLTHILVGFVLEFVLIKIVNPETMLANTILMAICLLGAILFAWIYSNLVESYFIKLSHRMFPNNLLPTATRPWFLFRPKPEPAPNVRRHF